MSGNHTEEQNGDVIEGLEQINENIEDSIINDYTENEDQRSEDMKVDSSEQIDRDLGGKNSDKSSNKNSDSNSDKNSDDIKELKDNKAKDTPKDELDNNSVKDISLEEDEEFNDFNEEDEFSDFGSFDDTSFNEPEQQEPQISKNLIRFDDELFENRKEFTVQLDKLMDSIFSESPKSRTDEGSPDSLLKGRSLEIFSELSTLPHLKPPNWIKLNIRHNLLIKLGIPINLDEIAQEAPSLKKTSVSSHLEVLPGKTTRKKSISSSDINWDGFEVPDIEKLNLSNDSRAQLLDTTPEILSRIETDILNNSSKQFLQDSSSEDALSKKLEQYQSDYQQLLTLSSVWNTHLAELTNNFEIYESVVQNFIGYSQKLRRDEILDNLKKVKKSNKKLW